MRWRGASRTGHTAPAKPNMNINQPNFNFRRKRSPLIDLDPPKPLAVGDVCPHCRQVVLAVQTEKTAEVPKPESENSPVVLDVPPIAPSVPAAEPVVEPVVVSKPKKSRANAPKN